jgi:hypothetical protein
VSIIITECPNCFQKNRLDSEKLHYAKCGNCKQSLVKVEKVAVEETIVYAKATATVGAEKTYNANRSMKNHQRNAKMLNIGDRRLAYKEIRTYNVYSETFNIAKQVSDNRSTSENKFVQFFNTLNNHLVPEFEGRDVTFNVLHINTYGYGHYYFYDNEEIFQTFKVIQNVLDDCKKRNAITEPYFKQRKFYLAHQDCQKKSFLIKVDNLNHYIKELDSYFL